jgi:hypothetical protein
MSGVFTKETAMKSTPSDMPKSMSIQSYRRTIGRFSYGMAELPDMNRHDAILDPRSVGILNDAHPPIPGSGQKMADFSQTVR